MNRIIALLVTVHVGLVPSGLVAQPSAEIQVQCDLLRDAHESLVAPFGAEGPEMGFVCLDSGEFAWAFGFSALEPARPIDDPFGEGFSGTRSLYRVTSFDSKTVASWDFDWGFYDQTIWSIQTTDYDGDGAAEILLGTTNRGAESDLLSYLDVLTYRDDALMPYPLAAGLYMKRAEDVDEDGRLDLILYSPYTLQEFWGLTGDPAFGPDVVAVSLADGSFTQTGAVAEAFLLSQCPQAPDLAELENWDGYFSEETFGVLVCAHYWGLPPEQILDTAQRLLGPSEPGFIADIETMLAEPTEIDLSGQ